MFRLRWLNTLLLVGFTAFFSVSLFESAIAADSNSVRFGDGDLFPAKNGNWWAYKTTDAKGKIGEVRYRLIDLKRDRNGDCSFKLFSNDPQNPKTKFYRKIGDKTFLTRVDVGGKSPSSVTFTPAKLVVDNKIEVGSIWMWSSKSAAPGSPSERWQVFPVEKVKVPAGEFTCLRIGGLMVNGAKVLYQSRMFSPNVGLVKSADSTGREKCFEELVSFHVK